MKTNGVSVTRLKFKLQEESAIPYHIFLICNYSLLHPLGVWYRYGIGDLNVLYRMKFNFRLTDSESSSRQKMRRREVCSDIFLMPYLC